MKVTWIPQERNTAKKFFPQWQVVVGVNKNEWFAEGLLPILSLAVASVWELYLVLTFRPSFEKWIWDLKQQSTNVYLSQLEEKKKKLKKGDKTQQTLSQVYSTLFTLKGEE